MLSAEVEAAVPPFRFSRMGPKGTGKQLGEPNRRKIAEAMTVTNADPRGDPGRVHLPGAVHRPRSDVRQDDPDGGRGHLAGDARVVALADASTSTSLYGAGPQDPGSAQFYSDGVHLKMGAADGGPAGQGFDLPRETPGQGATIPDERNDENLAVGQIHLAMIRFHNRVVDRLPASVPPAQRFQTARKIVTKHYQWMIRTDYLPRICAPSLVTNVFRNGRKAFEVGAAPKSMPTMPVEFSVAAFRLGHSMIRADYSWNKHFPAATLDQLFDFSGLMGDLGVGSPLPSIWIADFRRLFNFGEAGRPGLVVAAEQVQQGDAHRHEARHPAPDAARARPESAQEPRLPQPPASEHGQPRHRPADGHVPDEQGAQPDEADRARRSGTAATGRRWAA